MDNAFQELDYSDISAKNINKKPQPGLLDTKTRGGLIRLVIVIVFSVVIVALSFSLYSKYSTMKTLNEEYAKVKASHQSTLSEKQAVKEELDKYEKENDDLSAQIQAAKADNETLTAEIAKYTEDNNKLQKDIETIEKDVQNLTDELTQLLTQNDQLKIKISQITDENKELEDKIKQLKQ